MKTTQPIQSDTESGNQIHLVIKGPVPEAIRIAKAHDLSIMVYANDIYDHVSALVGREHLAAVIAWFNEASTVQMGAGYPPGTLLWYREQTDAQAS